MEHPLSQFKYCPKCGSARFEIHNDKSKQCADCGFVYYFNPSAATVALILNERNELLVCRRAKEPAKGTLDLPGGFIDMAETGAEGVSREVKEETGMEVTKTEYLFSLPNIYIYSGFPVHTLDLFSAVQWPIPGTSRQWTTQPMYSSCLWRKSARKTSGLNPSARGWQGSAIS